jgi:hypothetical protein
MNFERKIIFEGVKKRVYVSEILTHLQHRKLKYASNLYFILLQTPFKFEGTDAHGIHVRVKTFL